MGNGNTGLYIPDEIAINFKLYTHYVNYTRAATIREKKEGAKEVTIGTKGYIYIFRGCLNGEKASDGLIVSDAYQTLDLSKTAGITLAPATQNRSSIYNYFFAYSQIPLNDTRIKTIRQSLNNFIRKARTPAEKVTILGNVINNDLVYINRALYIPLLKNRYTSEYITTSADETADFNERGIVRTVYLQDWYGYLTDIAEQYDKKHPEWEQFLNDPVALSKYSRRGRSNGKDEFKRGDLYAYTEIINQVVASKSVKYSGNMFHHQNGSAGYKLFLEDFAKDQEKLIADYGIINLINTLIQNAHANATFTDYMYETETADEWLKTFGICTRNIELLMKKEEYKSLCDYIKKVFGQIPEDIRRSEQYDIEILTEKLGVTAVLKYLLVFGNIKFVSEESAIAFSFIINALNNMDVKAKFKINNYMMNGSFAQLVDNDGVLFTLNRAQLEKYMGDNKLKRLKDIPPHLEQAISKDLGDLNIQNIKVTPKIHRNRWHEVTVSGKRLSVEVKASDFLNNASNYELESGAKILKKLGWTEALNDVGEFIGLGICVWNIGLQISCIQKCDSLLDASPHVASMAGSILAAVAFFSSKQSFARTLGIVGMGLNAVEMGLKAGKYFLKDDTDAAAAFTASLLAFSGATVAMIISTGGVAAVFFAVGFLLSLLAEYLIDGAVDLVLKHGIWGINYGEDWNKGKDKIESWWPHESQLNINEVFLDTKQSIIQSDALKLYADDPEKTIERNIAMLNVAMQTCLYQNINTIECEYRHYEELLMYTYMDYILFKCYDIEFSNLMEMEISLSSMKNPDKVLFNKTYPLGDNIGSSLKYFTNYFPNTVSDPNDITNKSGFSIAFIRPLHLVEDDMKKNLSYEGRESLMNKEEGIRFWQRNLYSYIGRNLPNCLEEVNELEMPDGNEKRIECILRFKKESQLPLRLARYITY